MAALRWWWWTPAFVLPLVVAAAWPDPQRAARLRRETDQIMTSEEAAAAAQPVSQDASGIAQLNFKWLSFPLPSAMLTGNGEPANAGSVPSRIKQYDGARIRIRGFMLPVRTEGEKMRAFMILPSRTTYCYGQQPSFCEFISARMRDRPVQPCPDEPSAFEGVLHVSDAYVNGYWSALYTLDCTKVIR